MKDTGNLLTLTLHTAFYIDLVDPFQTKSHASFNDSMLETRSKLRCEYVQSMSAFKLKIEMRRKENMISRFVEEEKYSSMRFSHNQLLLTL